MSEWHGEYIRDQIEVMNRLAAWIVSDAAMQNGWIEYENLIGGNAVDATLRKEIRNGEAVAVKEEVRPYVDRTEWNLDCISTSEDGLPFLRFEIVHAQTSLDVKCPGTILKFVAPLELSREELTPESLIPFSENCSALIKKHHAVRVTR